MCAGDTDVRYRAARRDDSRRSGDHGVNARHKALESSRRALINEIANGTGNQITGVLGTQCCV
jgi:hypothetical protein